MIAAHSDIVEAVVFFEGGQISREMLLTEFEAILDSVVPMAEFSNRTASAVYLRINSSLHITAAVFFLIPFDTAGIAEQSWNVPLQQLADNSVRGPNLGAGPIALACASHCSVEWHQKNLWNPEVNPHTNSFIQLRKSIENNRLGLMFEGAPSDEGSPDSEGPSGKGLQEAEPELRKRMAQMLREQRMRLSLLSSDKIKSARIQQQKNLQKLEALQQQLSDCKSTAQSAEQRNKQLEVEATEQAEKVAKLRHFYLDRLECQEAKESSNLETLQQAYALEGEVKLSAATGPLLERVAQQEKDLACAQENEADLKQQVSALQLENQEILANSGDNLLQKLQKSGLSFVACHEGAGHLTIAVDEMSAYLADQESFVADKCGVSVNHYRQWLEHYKNPKCAALTASGGVCSMPIDRAINPLDFHMGESDRCSEHQTSSAQVFRR